MATIGSFSIAENQNCANKSMRGLVYDDCNTDDVGATTASDWVKELRTNLGTEDHIDMFSTNDYIANPSIRPYIPEHRQPTICNGDTEIFIGAETLDEKIARIVKEILAEPDESVLSAPIGKYHLKHK